MGSASFRNRLEEKSLSSYPLEDCGGAQRKELEGLAPLCLPPTGAGSGQLHDEERTDVIVSSFPFNPELKLFTSCPGQLFPRAHAHMHRSQV